MVGGKNGGQRDIVTSREVYPAGESLRWIRLWMKCKLKGTWATKEKDGKREKGRWEKKIVEELKKSLKWGILHFWTFFFFCTSETGFNDLSRIFWQGALGIFVAQILFNWQADIYWTKVFWKKRTMELLGAVCRLREKETSAHTHTHVFWKGQGERRQCALPTPVYHTYFYTKYFNNATCKNRSSPHGRAADRSYPTYESSSLVINFPFFWRSARAQ